MHEWLTHVIYHVGSGNVFFYGSAMILLGIALSGWVSHRGMSSVRNLLVLLGGIFVAISATPLSWWSYAVLGFMTLLWFVSELVFRNSSPLRKFLCRTGLAMLWMIYVGVELTHHVMPVLPPLGHPTFFLIGDSVSAGMVDADQGAWPKLLAAKHAIDVMIFLGWERRSDRLASKPNALATKRVSFYWKSAATTCWARLLPSNLRSALISSCNRSAGRTGPLSCSNCLSRHSPIVLA